MPGSLTPSLAEDVVRLGTWLPFGRVVGELQHFRQTDVSKATVRRVTERAGAAYVALQEGEVERIERELPEPQVTSAMQLVSVDGAMVPLVGGEWGEVRTLVIGEVLPPQEVAGERILQTSQHSYFSRLGPAETFTRLALVETHRRGLEKTPRVGAVTDGAEWCQSFIDHHRPDALRILDFPHAGEYVGKIAHLQWGEQETERQQWLSAHLHQLKHEGGSALLATLSAEIDRTTAPPALTGALAYLTKRQAHLDYPRFQEQGWPIGDGAVESANKLVVEARLKGSGMHWHPTQVNPMLALRTIAANDRWAEAWPLITTTLHQQAQHRTTQRRHQRHLARTTPPAPPPPTPPPAPKTPAQPKPHASKPWRPPPDHPWRRMTIGRTRHSIPAPPSGAKS